MTNPATITKAAMDRAIKAAQQGIRITIRPDGTVIVEPATVARQDDSPLDQWRAKRGQG